MALELLSTKGPSATKGPRVNTKVFPAMAPTFRHKWDSLSCGVMKNRDAGHEYHTVEFGGFRGLKILRECEAVPMRARFSDSKTLYHSTPGSRVIKEKKKKVA